MSTEVRVILCLVTAITLYAISGRVRRFLDEHEHRRDQRECLPPPNMKDCERRYS